MIIPVVITVYSDRSFTFIMKTPPACVLIKKALGLKIGEKPGSGLAGAEQGQGRQGHAGAAQRARRAEDAGHERGQPRSRACARIAGTARSMGVDVVD